MASAARQGKLTAGRAQQTCTHTTIAIVPPSSLQRLVDSSSSFQGVHLDSQCQMCGCSPIQGTMVCSGRSLGLEGLLVECTQKQALKTRCQGSGENTRNLRVLSELCQYCNDCWKQRQNDPAFGAAVSAVDYVRLIPIPWISSFQAGCTSCFLSCHLQIQPAKTPSRKPPTTSVKEMPSSTPLLTKLLLSSTCDVLNHGISNISSSSNESPKQNLPRPCTMVSIAPNIKSVLI